MSPLAPTARFGIEAPARAAAAAPHQHALAGALARLASDRHRYAHVRVRIADVGTLELDFNEQSFRYDFDRNQLPRCMHSQRYVLTAILAHHHTPAGDTHRVGRLCDLFWIAGLASATDLPVPPDTPLKLVQWPNFPQLPHKIEHIQLCGMLSAQPMSLREIEEHSAFDSQRVRSFVHAAMVAGFLERCSETEALFAPAPRALPKRGLLSRLLDRLGLLN